MRALARTTNCKVGLAKNWGFCAEITSSDVIKRYVCKLGKKSGLVVEYITMSKTMTCGVLRQSVGFNETKHDALCLVGVCRS